jgi:hypothetical protein
MIKQCASCFQELPEESFSITGSRTVKGETKQYRYMSCRDCRNKQRRVTDKRTKTLFFDGANKECSTCETIKPINEFAMKNGRPSFRCKSCHNTWYKEYYANNATNVKRNAAKWKSENITQWSRHGLTDEQFITMCNKFEGKCWVCKEVAGTVIDHDHAHCSGKVGCKACVRGLLCGHCNFMLGFAQDNVNTLSKAIEYLTGNIGAVL